MMTTSMSGILALRSTSTLEILYSREMPMILRRHRVGTGQAVSAVFSLQSPRLTAVVQGRNEDSPVDLQLGM